MQFDKGKHKVNNMDNLSITDFIENILYIGTHFREYFEFMGYFSILVENICD